MDEKELEALFSILKEDTGISTKESLSHIISNDGIEVIYDQVQEGIFNDIETFVGAFNSSKKKEEGSVSESGTSDGFDLETFFTPTEEQFAQSTIDENLQAPQKAVEKEVYEEYSRKERNEIDRQTIALLKEEASIVDEQFIEEQRKIVEVRGSEELAFDIDLINDDFIRKDSEDLIPQLTEKYGKYGFMFTRGRKVDGTIIARTSDGKNQIKFRTTNEFEDNDYGILKEFIAANAAPIEEIQDQDFLTKAFNVKNSRPTGMLNEDGSVSTVVMASADNIAFPTIFPKDPNSESKDPKDWHVFDTSTREGVEKAIAMAEERGEIYKFETDEEANDFAEGEWKDVKYTDTEGHEFFKDKGLDYATIMKSEKRYNEIRDEIMFLTTQVTGADTGGEYNFSTGEYEGEYKRSKELIESRPDIFLPNGSVRSDVRGKLAELQKEEDELFQLLRGDEKTSLAIDEYNLYLHKKFQLLATEAANKNVSINKEIESISQEWDNLTPEQQKNQLEEHNLKLSALKDAQDGLSDDYFLAKTYLNEKTRQEISKDFEEDFAALASSVKEGYNNGSAASILLAISLGMKDADKATAEEITYYLNNMNDTQSRALTRYQQGSTKESWNALLSSPIEVVTSMIASSLSQTVPIGLTLLSDPKIAAAIGTVGVLKGGKGGALGIAKSSLSTLQAASEFALEYSNAILDQAREAGYKINDPKQMLKAMQDPEVLRKGHEIGIRRGAAISGVSFLGSELSGKVFTVSKTASKGKKAAAFVGERIIYDPAIEAGGEAVAQYASGQKMSGSDIFDEYISGPFQNTATASISVFRQNDKQSKINFAYDLTKIDEISKATESNNRLSDWSTEMHRLGQIDDSVNNAIHENLTLKQDANDLLNLSKSKKTDKVRARTMELLKAQKTLDKDDNSKKIYKEELSKIDEELSYMVKEGKLAPDSKTVDIGNVKDPAGEIVSMASTPKSYKINGKRYTKAHFKKKYDRMSEKKKKKATFDIKNDPEFKSQINKEAGIMPSTPTSTTTTPTPTTTTTQVTDTDVTAIAEQSFGTIDEVPNDIRESATVIQEQQDGTFQVNDENYATIDAVPQEVMASDAVITEKKDGSVDLQYNEDKFTIEATPITDTFESMDQIPQNIKDAASTQIVENDKGEFEVTYKEAEALGQQMGKRKSEPRFRAKENKKAKADIEKRRKAELKEWKRDTGDLNAAWAVGSTQTIKEHINAKYATELAALDSQTKTLEKDGKQETTKKPVAGNRLFNEPLQDATKIAERITKRKGIDTARNEKIKKLNKERATKIAEAYENMEHRPNDPDVREAYNTLIDETIEQYEAIIEEGYAMEINNDDSYGNSKEMIEDLKDRKRMKVFSTESGFGSDGITDEMRKDNPMLAKTEYKDANGVPLLVNDIFRFVHDFFGHAKQGNGFGALGEENAWNIHSQMYSPTARKALTTETRGQNSWVNFSKVNEEAFKIRDEARALRKVGKLDEALKKVEEAYAMMKFAEQKIGLLPDEYTNIDAEIDSSDPRFRLKEGKGRISEDKKLAADVKEKQKKMSKAEKDFMVPRGKPVREDVNPLAESRSTTKFTEEDAEALGFSSVAEMTKKIEEYDGIPMGVVMSDPLAAGNHTDSTGGKIELGGGILFNTLGAIKNRILAWAGVNKEGANLQYQEAKMIYKANKALFDRLWKEKKLPYGHIPFAVAKMSQTAMNSNEANFRWLSPILKKYEAKNNKKLTKDQLNKLSELKSRFKDLESKMEPYKQELKEKKDQLKAEGKTTEEIRKLENKLKNPELKKLEKERNKTKDAIYRLYSKNRAKYSFEVFVEDINKITGMTPSQREKLAELNKKLEENSGDEKTQKAFDKLQAKQSKVIVLKFIKDNNITTMSQLMDAIVADSIKRAEKPENASLTLPDRAFLFNRVFSVATNVDTLQEKASPSKNWQRVLFKDEKGKFSREDYLKVVANSKSGVYNQITEPSMLEGRQGDIVAIVGIKVVDKNGKEVGGVAETKHNNYGYGPKGKLIAFLSNPMHGTDVFAEWEVKSARVFKQDKAGKVPSKTSLMSQIGGAFFIDKAFRGMKVSTQKRKVVDLLVAKMRHAFPSVGITSTQVEFDAIMQSKDVRTRVKDGMVIYGVTLDGNIYLNPEAVDIATPIHEFGHIWIDYLRYQTLKAPGGKAAKLLQKGLALAGSHSKFNEYKNKYGDTELAREELLVELMATRGETIVNKSLKAEFKEWFNAFFKYIKQTFKTSEKVTLTEIKKLTIEEFANIGLADLFGGTLLDGKFDPSTITDAMRARFSMETSDGSTMSLSDIISEARQEGYSDISIKDYLKTQGYKVVDINEAMAIHLDMFTQMPEAFQKVFDGSEEGINMFNDIKKKLDNWLKSRWGKGKSFTEYRTKAMDLLAEHKSFEGLSSINKSKLMSAVDLVIGRKKSVEASAPINSIIETANLIKEATWENNIPGAKKSLINALKPLAGTKLHKEKVSKINSIIKALDVKNHEASILKIEALLKEIIADDKAINGRMNARMNELQTKISSFNKISDLAKMKVEGSKVISNIKSISKALTKSIGKENQEIINKILTAANGLKKSNAKEKIPVIVEALNELYFKELMSNKKTTQMASVIKSLREKRNERNRQKKELAEIKKKVTQQIRKATFALRELGIKNYSYSEVQRLVAKVRDANSNPKSPNYIGKVSFKISNIFRTVEERGRRKKINQIKALITKNSKKNIGADGKALFKAMTEFMKLIKNKDLESLANAIRTREALKVSFPGKSQYRQAIKQLQADKNKKSLVDDIQAIESILQGEDKLPILSSVPEFIISLDFKNLQELNSIEQDIKYTRYIFAKLLANKKGVEKAEAQARNKELTEQLSKDHPYLFEKAIDEDGNPVVVDGKNIEVLKSQNQLGGEKGQPFRSTKVKEALQDIKESISTIGQKINTLNIASNFVGHLGTLCEVLDNIPAGMNFLTENIYNRLNRANSRFIKGTQDQTKKLDMLAASLGKIKEKVRFKGESIRDLSYKDIKSMIYKAAPMKNVNIKERLPLEYLKFKIITIKSLDANEQMRLYALYKNKDQRTKLINQGIDQQFIENIENNLGPTLVKFADLVVDYLSNEHYERVNNVHREVNNVNMKKIDDYFPTKTQSSTITKDANLIDMTTDSMVGNRFSSQYASFLKERTDRKSDVAIKSQNGSFDFTSELENHLGESERFVAYANDVKAINSIMMNGAVISLLKTNGLYETFFTLLNNAIIPVSNSSSGVTKYLLSAFVGKQIGFKPMQFLKQGSSFIMSFPEYTNNQTKDMNRVTQIAADFMLFSKGQAAAFINAKKTLQDAYNISPMFRDRVDSFKGKGGYAALETSVNESEAKNVISKLYDKLQTASGFFTMAGDITGVLGYWPVYQQDLKNGMDPQEALEKFEDYNKTQQSKRPTEMNLWQVKAKKEWWVAMATAFQSTIFLLQNEIIKSSTNMIKMVKNAKGKKNKVKAAYDAMLSKDGLKLYFSLGLANAAFTFISQIFKYIDGEDDEAEEVMYEMKKSMVGINQLIGIPFIGTAVETGLVLYEEKRYTPSDGINPYVSLVKDIKKAFKNDTSVSKEIFEYTSGINTDFFIGVSNLVTGQADEGTKYDIIGVPMGARPRSAK